MNKKTKDFFSVHNLERMLQAQMRENNLISASRYRYYYRKAKGGSYRSVAHMKTYLEAEGIVSEGGEL